MLCQRQSDDLTYQVYKEKQTDDLITVALTREEWNALDTFLLFTLSYGKQEQKIWKQRITEMGEDGKPRYKRAADNASYWRELNATMGRVEKAIRKACVESDSPVA